MEITFKAVQLLDCLCFSSNNCFEIITTTNMDLGVWIIKAWSSSTIVVQLLVILYEGQCPCFFKLKSNKYSSLYVTNDISVFNMSTQKKYQPSDCVNSDPDSNYPFQFAGLTMLHVICILCLIIFILKNVSLKLIYVMMNVLT